MKHDIGALVIAATLAVISISLFSFVHPYPQSVVVLVGGLVAVLAIWIVIHWKDE